MTEQHLHDAHLKKALEHAPDADAQASEQVRNTVLAYAKQAAKPRANWLHNIKNWLLKDHFANAQWAGLTGLAAVFLVTILLWREHPEDIVGIGDAPSVISESAEITQEPPEAKPDAAQKEVAAAPAATAQAELTQNQVAPAEVFIESQNIPATPPVAEEKQVNRPKSAIVWQSVQQNNTRLNNTQAKDKNLAEKTETDKLSKLEAAATSQSPPLAKKEIAEDIAVPEVVAPIEAAPAPTVIATPAPTTAPTSSDAALEAAPSKNKVLARGAAQAKPENATEGSISTNNDADFNVGHQDERRKAERHTLNANSVDNHVLAKTILQNGGQALATHDIQTGKYRLLKVVVHSENSANQNECIAAKTQTHAVDAQTGLAIENIDVCLATDKLMQEVAHYNQAMNAWFLKQNVQKK